MRKTKVIMNVIYIIIFLILLVICGLYIKKTFVDTDLEIPKISVSVIGSTVKVHATDNVMVYAYGYNTEDATPNTWYEANGKEIFDIDLRITSAGKYYIWVKDGNNNISNSATFDLSCESGNFNGITDQVYCPYSSVKAFGYNWHVLNDSEGYITLFMDANQLETMNHCDNLQTTEFCYYVSNTDYDSYAWDKSIINRYLNNEFIKKIDKELKDVSVCTDRSGQGGCIDDDGCAGYLSEDINSLGYFCHKQFIASKVRLLTFQEYNKILMDLKDEDKSWVYGTSKFWTMNGWRKPIYAASIDEKGSYIVDEITSSKLDVRPVIVVKK